MTDAQAENPLRQEFIEGMSFAAATVNVVTTDGDAGRIGVTVSAMSSVSADTAKPSLLVCINEASSGAAPILENGVFCVNILRDDQSFVSDTFAGRYGKQSSERFACGNWVEAETGAPILEDALVSFDCRVTNSVKVGTHHVIFGEVQAIQKAELGLPLIYANRAYGTPTKLSPIALTPPTTAAKSQTIRLGCLDTFGPFFVPELLDAAREAIPSVSIELFEGDQDQVVEWLHCQEVAAALLYDANMPDTIETASLVSMEPYALFAKDDPLAKAHKISLADLADEPLVLLDVPLGRDFFLGLFEHAGVEPNIHMRTASFEMVRSLVARGAGYSILVTRPSADISYEGMPLAMRSIENVPPAPDIAFATRAGSTSSSHVLELKNLCQSFFEKV